MKLEEALKYINRGRKIRHVSWKDHLYLDENDISNITLALSCLDDSWEHFKELERGIKIKIFGENLNFNAALEFHGYGYKIARESWKASFYVQSHQMYEGEKIHTGAGNDMFDFDDVTSDDWIAYK